MLKGIDISNWQGGLDLTALRGVDFAFMKATEGTGFVDAFCDPWVQQADGIGMLWGFYHFARSHPAAEEARFFIENTRNYFGCGIPVLDWETGQSVEWVNEFVRTVHAETGVWPWIYANPWRFNQGGVEPNCGRWIASYPDVLNPGLDYDPGEVPETDGLVVCWQYASDGQVDGYSGNLDVNHYFGSRESWARYAKAGSGNDDDSNVSGGNAQVLENDCYRVTIERR